MLRFKLRRVPFIRLLFSFITGIVVAFYFAPIKGIIGWTTFCFLVLFIVLLQKQRPAFRLYSVLGVHLFLMLSGFSLMQNRIDVLQPSHFSFHHASHLMIRVEENPSCKNQVVRFLAKVYYADSGIVSGNMLVYIYRDNTAIKLQAGDCLYVLNKATILRGPDNPGNFDFRHYLHKKNTSYRLNLLPGEWKLAKQGSPYNLWRISAFYSEKLVKRINNSLQDSSSAAFVAAMVLGYRSDLDKELVQTYADTGVLHILSVSGMHVGILFLVLNFLMSYLDKNKYTRWTKDIFIMLLIWSYAILSGLSPAVIRAAMMISFVIVSKLMNKHADILNILAVCAFVQLCFDPFNLFDYGFQLSYLALFSLLLFQPILSEYFFVESRIIYYFGMIAVASIAAQVLTFPLSLYYFQQFPALFIFSNLIAIPLSSCILILGLVLLFLCYVPFLNLLLKWSILAFVFIMNHTLQWIDRLPFATIHHFFIDPLQCILFYLLILLASGFFIWKIKSAVRITLLLLICYYSIRLFETFQYTNRKELIVYRFKDNAVCGLIYQDRAYVLCQKKTEVLSIQKMILSGLKEKKVRNIEFFSWDSCFSRPGLWVDHGFAGFLNKRIAFIDGDVRSLDSLSHLKVDYLLFSVKRSLFKKLVSHFSYQLCIPMDSSFPDKLFSTDMPSYQLYSLRKRGAFFVSL